MSLASRHFVAAFCVSLAVGSSVAACSGSSASPIPDGTTSGGVDSGPTGNNDNDNDNNNNNNGVDGGATGIDGSTSHTDGSVSPVDGGKPVDSGKDTGAVTVHEEPAPDCHDLVQQASLVTATGDPDPPPAQVPIATIEPGLYILISAVDYGGLTPVVPISADKTTTVFTATRQYYLSESATQPAQRLTLDWKVKNNRLTRSILCGQSANQTGSTVDYRIDGAPNGFIVYVPVQGDASRTRSFRYKRVD